MEASQAAKVHNLHKEEHYLSSPSPPPPESFPTTRPSENINDQCLGPPVGPTATSDSTLTQLSDLGSWEDLEDLEYQAENGNPIMKNSAIGGKSSLIDFDQLVTFPDRPNKRRLSFGAELPLFKSPRAGLNDFPSLATSPHNETVSLSHPNHYECISLAETGKENSLKAQCTSIEEGR
jgi:hypothetical protein